MSLHGSIVTQQRRVGGNAGVVGAENGCSINDDLKVVLGNDEGDPAAPAALFNNREIETRGRLLRLLAQAFADVTLQLSLGNLISDGDYNTMLQVEGATTTRFAVWSNDADVALDSFNNNFHNFIGQSTIE